MLNFKMINEDVLEVIESSHTFTKTTSVYWYYNIKNWKKSRFGKQGDVPDTDMNQNDIDWVTKYYLPKVGM